jgi:transcriptional regulator PpsR
VKAFIAPKKSLGNLDAESAAMLLTAATGLALVLDRKGAIRDVAFGSDELAAEISAKWLGKAWSETVTVDSRPKIELLLRDAASGLPPRWRQVNHPTPGGLDVPILYNAVRVGKEGRTVAVGRDLRVVAALQQRLMDAEQSTERDYVRLRHSETRYRLLFQIASEAVLIVDASTQKIVEANPAAEQLLGADVRRLIGRTFPEGFDADGAQAIQSLLGAVRAAGRADDVQARTADAKREFIISAALFRQEHSSHFLVRLSPMAGHGARSSQQEA